MQRINSQFANLLHVLVLENILKTFLSFTRFLIAQELQRLGVQTEQVRFLKIQNNFVVCNYTPESNEGRE